MKPRLLIALCSLLGLALLAGCGGGGGGETTAAPVETAEETALTKEELIQQGDAICAEVNAAVGTVSSTAGSSSAARVKQEADLYSGMVERLKGLGAPAEESAGYSEFITSAEQLAQAEDNARLAAERGEESGLSSAESTAGSALSSFQEAAEAYGFRDCAEAPSAPTPTTPGGGAEEEAGGVEAEAEGEVEEAAPEEVEEAAPEEEAGGVEEEAGGGAGVGGGTGGGTEGEAGGGGSGGIGPG